MHDSMNIKIADIRTGLVVRQELDADYFGLTKEDYVHFVAPIKIVASLQRLEDVVIADVKISTVFESYCSRTLKEVEKEWSQEFNLDFAIGVNLEYIDIADDIRQEVIMRLPMRVLSEEEQNKEFVSLVEVEPQSEGEDHMHKPFENLKLND